MQHHNASSTVATEERTPSRRRRLLACTHWQAAAVMLAPGTLTCQWPQPGSAHTLPVGASAWLAFLKVQVQEPGPGLPGLQPA